MDINSIKHVQDRIKEIKSRFKTIQNTYTKISHPSGMVMTNNKAAETSKSTAVQETNDSQKSNTANIKITEEILKNMLKTKRENGKDAIDVQQIQNLLQKAITQYTSNGKIFNIDE